LPTPQASLSVGAIAGLAVAGFVVAVIAVILSDARIALSFDRAIIVFSVCHFHSLLLREYNDSFCFFVS
jgi:hypothetical protein